MDQVIHNFAPRDRLLERVHIEHIPEHCLDTGRIAPNPAFELVWIPTNRAHLQPGFKQFRHEPGSDVTGSPEDGDRSMFLIHGYSPHPHSLNHKGLCGNSKTTTNLFIFYSCVTFGQDKNTEKERNL